MTGHVIVDITMSLDGYVTAPGADVDHGLGVDGDGDGDGEPLHFVKSYQDPHRAMAARAHRVWLVALDSGVRVPNLRSAEPLRLVFEHLGHRQPGAGDLDRVRAGQCGAGAPASAARYDRPQWTLR